MHIPTSTIFPPPQPTQYAVAFHLSPSGTFAHYGTLHCYHTVLYMILLWSTVKPGLELEHTVHIVPLLNP